MHYVVTITQGHNAASYPTLSPPERIHARYRAALTDSERMTPTPDGFAITQYHHDGSTTVTKYSITPEDAPR